MYASLVFGITGVVMILSGAEPDKADTVFDMVLAKILFTSVFVILTSFAISVATKYLGGKS